MSTEFNLVQKPTLTAQTPISEMDCVGKTIRVVRSTALLDMTDVQWVNFIGPLEATLDTSTMGAGGYINFVNTGLAGPATIRLSNGSTISGESSYDIPSGQANTTVVFLWDGTNLS